MQYILAVLKPQRTDENKHESINEIPMQTPSKLFDLYLLFHFWLFKNKQKWKDNLAQKEISNIQREVCESSVR